MGEDEVCGDGIDVPGIGQIFNMTERAAAHDGDAHVLVERFISCIFRTLRLMEPV